ncbi:hypothetical protein [Streptomyces sp. NBC_01264]|uniref:hypothetical protein n=1 Tax=Streptomyces sp. NBC_01264 TaxID=2903804 RepID=UPI00224E926F|nr:hypothetical protein [Streptomyces sp. NBC_01264]MCX4781038.1 hypothetical protein [Streptomyces sp. NBC_01264]
MSNRPTAFEERLKTELVAIAADRAESAGGADLVAARTARRPRIPKAAGPVATAARVRRAARAVAGLVALRKPAPLEGLPQE